MVTRMERRRLPDLFDLTGRHALVTGGAGHLGRAMARALAEAGASVVIAGRDLAAAREAASGLRASGGRATALRLDVTNSRSVDRAIRSLDGLDILVNNAYSPPGLPRRIPPHRARFPEDADWMGGVDGSLGSVFRLVRAALPLLRGSGRASVINVATMYAIVSPDHGIYRDSGQDNPAYYGAAKAGILQLTRYWARLLARERIRVNAVSPGPFPHPYVGRSQRSFLRRLEAKVPLGRVGVPEELMGAVVFLAGDASSYVTGHNLVVDGGWTT